MAKLYWRVKLNGKWNWRNAGTILDVHLDKTSIKMIVARDGYRPPMRRTKKKKEEPGEVVDSQRTRICDEESGSLSADKNQEGGIND